MFLYYLCQHGTCILLGLRQPSKLVHYWRQELLYPGWGPIGNSPLHWAVREPCTTHLGLDCPRKMKKIISLQDFHYLNFWVSNSYTNEWEMRARESIKSGLLGKIFFRVAEMWLFKWGLLTPAWCTRSVWWTSVWLQKIYVDYQVISHYHE